MLFNNFLLIFGGKLARNKFSDSIYLLDLNNENNGWNKLDHVKCPIPSQYIAVLTNDLKVHLFTKYNKPQSNLQNNESGNYSLPIASITGPKYIIINGNKDLDQDDNKCDKCDALMQENQELKLQTQGKEKEK